MNVFQYNTKVRKNSIYLLYPSDIAQKGEFVFKFGKTYSPLNRFQQYPKKSTLVYFCRVIDCHHVENEILEMFKQHFKQRSDYGREYFETDDVRQMIKCIDGLIDHMDQRLPNDMMNSMKSTYKNHLKFTSYDINDMPINLTRILRDSYSCNSTSSSFQITDLTNIEENVKFKVKKTNDYDPNKILNIGDDNIHLTNDEKSVRSYVNNRAKFLNVKYEKRSDIQHMEAFLLDDKKFAQHFAFRMLHDSKELSLDDYPYYNKESMYNISQCKTLVLKIRLIKQIETILGVKPLDIDTQRDMRHFNKKIHIDDDVLDTIRTTFRISKDNHKIIGSYETLYYQLIQLYKHVLDIDFFVYEAVTINKSRHKKYTVNTNVIKEHSRFMNESQIITKIK